MVVPGQTLAKVAGLSKLWPIVEVPEAQPLQVRPAMSVDAIFPGDATQHFEHVTAPRARRSSRTGFDETLL